MKVDTIPQSEAKEHLLREKAAELLDSPEVTKVIQTLDSNVHFINQTGPFVTTDKNEKTYSRKLDRFLGKNLGLRTRLKVAFGRSKQFFLRDFWQDMESEEAEITHSEAAQLKSISEKLEQHTPLIAELTQVLLEAQKINLERRGLDKKQIDIEQKHITEVVELCSLIFPQFPILQLTAAVHDSYKHVAPGYTELGLHEIASAALGPELIGKVLTDHAEQLGLSLREIQLIQKLAKRAIYTHGNGEFPEQKSFSSAHVWIRNLFGGLYVLPKKRAARNIFSTNLSTADLTIVAMNYLDAVTGTNHTSFIKYSSFYSSNQIVECVSLSEYFENYIFQSFETNMNMASGIVLQRLRIENLDKLIQTNRLVKKLLDISLSNNPEQLKKYLMSQGQVNSILDNVTYTKAALSELKIAVNSGENIAETRKIFDARFSGLVNAVHDAVVNRFQDPNRHWKKAPLKRLSI